MTEELLRVSTDDGKYTVVQHASGQVSVLRYGQPWRDGVFDNVLVALAYDLEAARAGKSA